MTAMDTNENKQHFCPQCKEWQPLTHFNALPLDLRCSKCIPITAALALYEDKVKLAGQKVCQLVDAADECRSLRSLSGMLEDFYDAWGGRMSLTADAVEWCKDLGSTPRGKAHALSFLAKVLSIHSKVEKTKVDEDWNKLSKAEIKAKLTVLLTDILARSELPEAKQQAIQRLIGGQE